MNGYTITINGCHFSDAMTRYSLTEMKEFLKKKKREYEFVSEADTSTEYNYLSSIAGQRSYIHYDSQGKFVSMNHDG